MSSRTPTHPRGAIALLALLGVMAFVLMVMTTVAALATGQSKITGNAAATEQTFYAAEAGVNQALYKLATNPAASNFTTTVGSVSVSIIITPSGFQRIVTATATDLTGKVRVLRVIVNAPGFGGGFTNAVQSGAGGVSMDNGSRIIGDLFSNGTVTGSSQATIQGNATIANDATVDQQDFQQTAELAVGQSASNSDAAQKFTAGATGTLNRVSFFIRQVGAPNLGNTWWRITNDNGGKPATTALAQGDFGTLSVSSTLGWVNANVPTPVSLTAGTRYWIVLDAANNTSNYLAWGMDSSDGYAGGSGYYTNNWSSGGAVWTQAEVDGADLTFKTWLGSTNTRLENVTVTGNAYANRITGTGGSSYARVCGDAYYDTIDNSGSNSSAGFLNSATAPAGSSCPNPWTPGTGYPGSADQAIKSLPITSAILTTWKNDISTTNVPPTSGTCPVSYAGWYCVMSNTSLGNVKITNASGVYVDGAVTVTLTGNVWVTGQVVFGNSGSGGVQASLSLGEASAVLVVDGAVSISNNYGFQGSGNPKSFVVIATNSSATSAIIADNGSSSLLLAAPNGEIDVQNNGTLNAAIANKLYLKQNSTVTFNSNLASLYVPSNTPTPLTAVTNSWAEQ